MKLLACSILIMLSLGSASAQQAAPPAPAFPQMEVYYLMDDQAQIPVCGIHGPAGWNIESVAQWNFNSVSVPFVMGAALTDPQGNRGVQFFPETTCFWLTGDAAHNDPGAYKFGMLNVAPMEPEHALVEAVTKIYQSDIADLRITGVRRVPGLAAALGQAGPNVTGVGLRAEFTLDGVAMEQEVYALHVISSASMRGEVGVTTQITWGLTSVHGFITPLGQMDANRSMFTYIVRSVVPNPAWVQLFQNIKQQIETNWNQQLTDSRLAREAIMAQSRALAARNEQFRANIMSRHRAAMDTSGHKSFIAGIHGDTGAASGGGRSAHERYIDGIHEVETFHDPSTVTGTSQHGYANQHWSDGWGGYIHSDNPNYDPNIGSTIGWQELQRVE